MLNDTCTGATVSSRTLSFPLSFGPEVSLIRAGAAVALSEVAGTLDAPVWAPYPGRTIASKYNFVCVSIARRQLAAYYGPKSARSKSNFLACIDGLNSAGLSCALLYQGLTRVIPTYDPQNKAKPDALNVEDMCAFALARFDSAPALKRYIEQRLQLTHPGEIYGEWATLMAQGRHNAPPEHFSITDAKGRGIVVQVRDGQVQVLDNQYGVFTNEPFLQEQEANVTAFERAMLSNPADVYPSVKRVTVPELKDAQEIKELEEGKIKFLPLPGDFSSPSRFTRMALTLKYGTRPTCWNSTSILDGTQEPLNPAYVPAGAPPHNQALLAIMGITNEGYLPRGLDDHGMAGSAAEWTPFASLRDHTSRAFFLRTANSPLYRQYDLKTIDWTNTGKSGFLTVPLTTPGETWFVKERL